MSNKFIIVLVFILALHTAYAAPGLPTDYYGDLLLDGVPAPTGTVVVSYAAGVNYANYTVDTGGQYGFLSIPGDDTVTGEIDGGVDGDNVTFKVLYQDELLDSPNTSIFNTSKTFEVNIVAFDTLAPSPVSGLSALDTADAEQSVNLSWDASTETDLTLYKIYRHTSSFSDVSSATNIANATNNTYVDTTVSDGTTYHYAVTALDDQYNEDTSVTSVSVTPVDDLSPAQVSGIVVSSENTTLNLTWNEVTTNEDSSAISDLAGYRVYGNESGSWQLITSVSGTSYEDNTLTNNQRYYFRIAAYDDDGNEGQNSSVVSGVPSERPLIAADAADYATMQTADINISITSGINLDTVLYVVKNNSDGIVDQQTNVSVAVPTWNYVISPNLWSEFMWYTVFVEANDTNGRNNSALYNYRIDDTNPLVTGLNVNESVSQSSDSVTVEATVSDQTSVSDVTVGVAGNEATMTNISGTHTAVATPSALGCSEGTCTLTVTATDVAGNVNGTSQVQFDVDDTAPSLNVVLVSDYNVTSSTTLELQTNVADAHTITSVLVSGGSQVALDQNSPGIYGTNTTPSALSCSEGACVLTFSATDEAGNTNSSVTATIQVDDTAPSVSNILTDDADNVVAGSATLKLNATFTDNFAVDHVNISVGGGSPTTLSLISGDVYGASFTPNALGCAQGTCTIDFTAIDQAGNLNATVTLDLTVDDANPNVSGVAVSDSVVNSTQLFEINATVADASAVTVTASNDSSVNMSLVSGNLYQVSTTAASLGCGEGTCTIVITATDAVGQVNSTEFVDITVDDTAPTTSKIIMTGGLVNSTDNIFRTQDTVEVNITVTDTNGLESVLANGVSMTADGDIYTLTTTLENLKNETGVQFISFAATDNAGNVQTASYEIEIDNTDPVISSVTLSDDYIQDNTEVEVTVVVSDSNLYNVSAQGVALTDMGSSWMGNVTLTSSTSNVTVVAVDLAGNFVSDESASYIIDDALPVLHSFSLSDDYVQNGTDVTVTLNVSDNNLSSYMETIVDDVGGSANAYPLAFDEGIITRTVTLLDNIENITYRITDEAGNYIDVVIAQNANFTIDDTAPTFVSTSVNDSYVSTGQRILISADVSDGKLASVTADGNTMINDSGTYKYNHTVGQASYVTLVATDAAGNIKTTNVTFTVDNTAPSLTLQSPIDGSSVSNADGNVTVNVTVTETNMTKFNMTVDGKYYYGSTSNGTHVHTFAGLQPGTHTLVLSAHDEAGLSASSSTTFTVLRPLNMTQYVQTLQTSLGNKVLTINFTVGGSDVGGNDTLDINTSISLELKLNISGKNATAIIPAFSGLNANWEHIYTVDADASSSKGQQLGRKGGTDVDKMLLFENMSNFLGNSAFSMAKIMFTDPLGLQDVLYIADDDVDSVYKLSACASVPSSVASVSEACYVNASKVTLYLPHFSGGAIVNDTQGPSINITAPNNNSVFGNSFLNLTAVVHDANLDACNYTMAGTSGTLGMTNNPQGSTTYEGSKIMHNVSDGNYTVKVACSDTLNQTTEEQISVEIIDTTAPQILNYGPSTSQSSSDSSVSVSLTATTNEWSYCRYHATSQEYASMTAMGSSFALSHSKSVSLSSDGTYSYYVVCQDAKGYNSTAEQISFSVDVGTGDDGGGGSTSDDGGDDTSGFSGMDTGLDSSVRTRVSMSWLDLQPGQEITFRPNSEAIAIKKLQFVMRNALQRIKLQVEVAQDVPEEMDGVYQYLEIEPGMFSSSDVEDVVIEFEINESWLENHENITVFRYRNRWVALDTEHLDANTYSASTPGFSVFAIAGKVSVETEPAVEPEVPPVEEEPPVEQVDEPVEEPEEPGPRVWPYILLFLIIAGGVGVYLYGQYKGGQGPVAEWMKSLKDKFEEITGSKTSSKTSRHSTKKATLQQLHEYVQEAKKNGISGDQIRAQLEKAGWPKNLYEKELLAN